MTVHEFEATPWQWTGNGAQWVFVTLPDGLADEIEAKQTGPGRGFGAVRVRVGIGDTTWETSMFPSREHQSYILPLKAAVRKTEQIETSAAVRLRVETIAV